MRDHAPVTETTKTGTLKALSQDLYPAASGNLADGSSRPSAPLFPYPAPRTRDAGEGHVRDTFSPPRQVPPIPRNSRLTLIKEIAGDLIGVACIFFIPFAGLFFGSIQ